MHVGAGPLSLTSDHAKSVKAAAVFQSQIALHVNETKITTSGDGGESSAWLTISHATFLTHPASSGHSEHLLRSMACSKPFGARENAQVNRGRLVACQPQLLT
jgi:hypothetical protein